MPALSGELVQRSRIDEQLGALVSDCSIVMVVATAGAGKTTAVVHAMRHVGLPVAWLGVSSSEQSPGRLLTYLEAALASRVPDVAGVATRALVAGVSHQEAAGVLAEALGEHAVVLVLDDLERLLGSEEAFGVIEAFARWSMPNTRLVLIGREELPLDLGRAVLMGRAGAIGESELAFTVEEAGRALRLAGAVDIDAEEAVAATGGWVAGVVFEAWRSAPHLPLIGGEADPLHGYLSSSILAQLSEFDRDFLIETSLLDEVDATRAERLGRDDAAERLASLRGRHLPLTWKHHPLTMRAHPRFREFLRERLERRGAQTVAAARGAFGRLLVSEGRDEEAVEELLAGGAPYAAVAAAERAIIPVLDRLDLGLARRWLDLLADVRPVASPRLTTAELMLAIGSENWAQAIEVADGLSPLDRRGRVARTSPRAAALMAWSYFHAGRLDDARVVLEAAERTPETAVMWYCLSLAWDEVDDSVPPVTHGPLDALIVRVDYYRGFFDRLLPEAQPPWTRGVAAPWQIGALVARGRLEEAAARFDAASAVGGSGYLATVSGADLLYDLGRPEEAWRALDRADDALEATGSDLLPALAGAVRAKLLLRHRADVAAAHALLDRIDRQPGIKDYAFVREQSATWRGLAYLLEDRDAQARGVLRDAVASMRAGNRWLLMSTAAVYLAEAEWRADAEDAADRAMELAAEASERVGSNHLMLHALRDFPAAVARRIDAEADGGSDWHRIGRALRADGAALRGVRPAPVHVREFGTFGVDVDGRATPLRLTKACLLLAYLAATPEHADRRSRVVEALFDGGTDASVTAYLRQAAHRARQALPPGVTLTLTTETVAVAPGDALTSDSVRFEALLGQAARLPAADRLPTLLRALAPADRGDYLPGVDLPWANERRRALTALRDDALVDAATLSYANGGLDDAERFAGRVIAGNPLREDAWQARMRVHGALGDYAAVLRDFADCERALAEVGARPTRTTAALVDQLRR